MQMKTAIQGVPLADSWGRAIGGRSLALLTAALLALACTAQPSAPPPTSEATLGASTTPSSLPATPTASAATAYALTTDPRWGCPFGVGADVTIRGSLDDPKRVWGIDNSSGARVELLWPPGYSARFEPDLVIIDEDGEVVGHDADLIIGACMPPRIDPADYPGMYVYAANIRPPTWKPGDG